jgi:hypothetical protein
VSAAAVPATTPAKRSLRDDRRGAILIAAVFMATFLVGCLWYVMGIGDAILYRQRMQDGADAVAYAGAVYHARGMNIIAMLNLVMAAILAVLVWLKIAQVLLWSLMAILVGLCFFGGWACGAIPVVKNVETQVQNAIDRVEPIVDKWLKALSKLQGYVARTTPYIAGGRSVIAAQGYGPTVEFGLGVSTSMRPQGERLGLPVQEEEFGVLCEKAGTIAANVSPLGVLSAAGVPGADLVAGLVGSLVATFPGYFCDQDGSGAGSSAYEDQMAENALKQCKEAKKAADAEDEDNDFDVDDCYDKALEELEKNGAGATMDGEGKTPKRVFYAARNGDRFFQVYGLVLGDTFYTQKDEGVEMAAWGESSVRTASTQLTRLGVAQAEFYYDQVRPGRLDWEDYEEDAMWNLRWRARLRRVRLTSGLGGLVESSLPDWIPSLPGDFSGLQDQMEGALGGLSNDALDQIMNQNLGDGTTPELAAEMVGAVGQAKVIH